MPEPADATPSSPARPSPPPAAAAAGRLFILGADGATWNVVNRLVAAGRLLNFRRLMEEGVYGPLASVENMRSASAWTSMFTGYNPGRHGIYEFYEFLPAIYSLKYIHGGYKQVPGFWTYLDAAGQSTGVINTPMTYPAEATKTPGGYMIAGLDGPGKQSPRFGFPDDFIARLEAAMGCEYVIEPGLTGAIAKGHPEQAVELLRGELESKHRALRIMLDEMPVDVLLFVFRSLDAAQHCFWKWMDPTHPKHKQCTAAEIERFGGVIDGVYEKLDAALSDILARARPEDHVVVISDHGFGHKCPVSSQLNRWLEAHGYLAYEAGGKKPNAVSKALRFVASHTSRGTKEKLARLMPGLRNWAQSKALFSGVDLSRTRVYSDAQFPRLRLNVKGREGQGIVEPDDMPALMEELRAKLLDMRDSVTGERIVADVFFSGEIYHGPHTGPGEDILVRWREDVVIHGVKMPEGYEMPTEELSVMPGEDPRVISGDHQVHGVFLAKGPAFWSSSREGSRDLAGRAGAAGGPISSSAPALRRRAGEGVSTSTPTFSGNIISEPSTPWPADSSGKPLGLGPIHGLRLLDLTPTILHLRGLPIPDAMDGRVLASTLDDTWLAAHPVLMTAGAAAMPSTHASEAAEFGQEDQKVLEERLRSLGYIE